MMEIISVNCRAGTILTLKKPPFLSFVLHLRCVKLNTILVISVYILTMCEMFSFRQTCGLSCFLVLSSTFFSLKISDHKHTKSLLLQEALCFNFD